jgi:hypothetical protein
MTLFSPSHQLVQQPPLIPKREPAPSVGIDLELEHAPFWRDGGR